MLILCAVILSGCGGNNTETASSIEAGTAETAADVSEVTEVTETEAETEPETEAAPAVIADLNGNWIESGWQDADTYMLCVVSDSEIEIAWCMDGGETVALYWAGTAPAPTEPGDYTWDSANDKEQTDYAILASSDDHKTFEYHADTDEITYSQSAMGVTRTVHMIRYIE